MTSKRKLVRSMWARTRTKTKDGKGNVFYSPSWYYFKKDYIKENNLTIVSFLKAFPRKKRIDMVDILRGALPVPIDYKDEEEYSKYIDAYLTNMNSFTYDYYPLRVDGARYGRICP